MSQISFEGPAVMVRDMKASRRFYETLLGQEVLFEVGGDYVHYATGFSLWYAPSAAQTIYGEEQRAEPERKQPGCESFELYFETAALETTWEALFAQGVPAVHEIRTQPWGQRCFRVKDPDDYLVEIGEPMAVVAGRFLAQGLSVAETAQRTLLPESLVEAIRDGKLE